MAAPVSYRIGEDQYIAVVAGVGGAGGMNFAPKIDYVNAGQILAWKLKGKASMPEVQKRDAGPGSGPASRSLPGPGRHWAWTLWRALCPMPWSGSRLKRPSPRPPVLQSGCVRQLERHRVGRDARHGRHGQLCRRAELSPNQMQSGPMYPLEPTGSRPSLTGCSKKSPTVPSAFPQNGPRTEPLIARPSRTRWPRPSICDQAATGEITNKRNGIPLWAST